MAKIELDRWLVFTDGSRLSFELNSGPSEHGDLVITINAKSVGGLSTIAALSYQAETEREKFLREWFKQAMAES